VPAIAVRDNSHRPNRPALTGSRPGGRVSMRSRLTPWSDAVNGAQYVGKSMGRFSFIQPDHRYIIYLCADYGGSCVRLTGPTSREEESVRAPGASRGRSPSGRRCPQSRYTTCLPPPGKIWPALIVPAG
jgi:hypothetical protein